MDDLNSPELLKKKLEELDAELATTIQIIKDLPKHGVFFKGQKDMLGRYKGMKEEIEFYLADLEEGEEWKKGVGKDKR